MSFDTSFVEAFSPAFGGGVNAGSSGYELHRREKSNELLRAAQMEQQRRENARADEEALRHKKLDSEAERHHMAMESAADGREAAKAESLAAQRGWVEKNRPADLPFFDAFKRLAPSGRADDPSRDDLRAIQALDEMLGVKTKQLKAVSADGDYDLNESRTVKGAKEGKEKDFVELQKEMADYTTRKLDHAKRVYERSTNKFTPPPQQQQPQQPIMPQPAAQPQAMQQQPQMGPSPMAQQQQQQQQPPGMMQQPGMMGPQRQMDTPEIVQERVAKVAQVVGLAPMKVYALPPAPAQVAQQFLKIAQEAASDVERQKVIFYHLMMSAGFDPSKPAVGSAPAPAAAAAPGAAPGPTFDFQATNPEKTSGPSSANRR